MLLFIHYVIGFSIVALGLGLMIWSYFLGWTLNGWAVFSIGIIAIGLGSAYLWG